MTTYRAIPALLALAGLVFSTTVLADDAPDGTTGATGRTPHFRHGPPGVFGGAPEQMLGRMADELQLSAEQQDAMRGLAERYRPRWESLRAQIADTRRSMMSLSPDDPEYASVTAEVSQRAAGLAAEMVTLAGAMQTETYALLTEEQRERWKELKTQRQQRFESWRSRRSKQT